MHTHAHTYAHMRTRTHTQKGEEGKENTEEVGIENISLKSNKNMSQPRHIVRSVIVSRLAHLSSAAPEEFQLSH